MSGETSPDLTFAPALVVFGRDEALKPHACCFAADEAELAEKAAGLMGMQVLRARERARLCALRQGRPCSAGSPALAGRQEPISPSRLR